MQFSSASGALSLGVGLKYCFMLVIVLFYAIHSVRISMNSREFVWSHWYILVSFRSPINAALTGNIWIQEGNKARPNSVFVSHSVCVNDFICLISECNRKAFFTGCVIFHNPVCGTVIGGSKEKYLCLHCRIEWHVSLRVCGTRLVGKLNKTIF